VQKIAEHVITLLINLSGDLDVLQSLAEDDRFLDLVLERLTVRLSKLLSQFPCCLPA
jgi:hypothetical protein